MHIATAYGTTWYDSQGPGYPIVLIHGFPLNSRMWEPQIQPLIDAGYRVILPDLPGFGYSDIVRSTSISEMAFIVQAILRDADAEPAFVAGMSMGGYVALALQEVAPESISGLGLIFTRSDADTDEARQNRLKLAQRVEQQGTSAAADIFIRKVLGEPSRHRERMVRDQLMMSNSPAGVANALRAMADRPDATHLLETISVPTLVMTAEDDRAIAPDISQQMLQHLPRGTGAHLPCGGHMANLEYPEAFNDRLIGFLSEQGFACQELSTTS